MLFHRHEPPPAPAAPDGRPRHPLSARVARAALFAALLVVCAAVAAPPPADAPAARPVIVIPVNGA
ncbi:unnamed protein product, partial [marine sediment metagenome]